MMHRSGESFSERDFRRPAYSRAVSGSWMEHGPTTTRSRSSRFSMISMAWLRPERTDSMAVLDYCQWLVRCAGLLGWCDSRRESRIAGIAARGAGRSPGLFISVWPHLEGILFIPRVSSLTSVVLTRGMSSVRRSRVGGCSRAQTGRQPPEYRRVYGCLVYAEDSVVCSRNGIE